MGLPLPRCMLISGARGCNLGFAIICVGGSQLLQGVGRSPLDETLEPEIKTIRNFKAPYEHSISMGENGPPVCSSEPMLMECGVHAHAAFFCLYRKMAYRFLH